LAIEVECRAAGVAAVNGCVDLHIVVGTRTDVAALRRHDAGRHGAAETERVAHRDHPVTDPRLLLSELYVGESLRRLDLEQREVGALIGADQLRLVFGVLVEADLDLATAIDHVVVGDDVAVRRDDETRALRLGRPRGPLAAVAPLLGQVLEELVEWMIVRKPREHVARRALGASTLRRLRDFWLA